MFNNQVENITLRMMKGKLLHSDDSFDQSDVPSIANKPSNVYKDKYLKAKKK